MKKTLAALFLFIATGVFASIAGAEGPSIAYVDLQMALNGSAAGKAAREVFKGEVERIQKDLDAKQNELEKLKNELEKQAMLLSPEAKAEKEKEYQEKIKIVQRFYQDAQEELQGKDTQLTKSILLDMKNIISALGKEKGYTVILEKNESSILYGDQSADITEEVVKRLNGAKKKGN